MTHHNRVERIQALIDAGRVIEPLVDFYKDEVRVLGEELGLPHDVVWRHPFPGPGLAVRCLCAEARAAVDLVTRIVRARGLYDAIWQMPVAMLPLGGAPGRETIVLRPVNSRDGMTADFARLPAPVVAELARALGGLPRVDAVLYDVTNKPPATIELE